MELPWDLSRQWWDEIWSHFRNKPNCRQKDKILVTFFRNYRKLEEIFHIYFLYILNCPVYHVKSCQVPFTFFFHYHSSFFYLCWVHENQSKSCIFFLLLLWTFDTRLFWCTDYLQTWPWTRTLNEWIVYFCAFSSRSPSGSWESTRGVV